MKHDIINTTKGNKEETKMFKNYYCIRLTAKNGKTRIWSPFMSVGEAERIALRNFSDYPKIEITDFCDANVVKVVK